LVDYGLFSLTFVNLCKNRENPRLSQWVFRVAWFPRYPEWYLSSYSNEINVRTSRNLCHPNDEQLLL